MKDIIENPNEKLYDEWLEANAKRKYYVELEKKLRLDIVEPLIESLPVGTHTFTTEDGYVIKPVKRVSVSFDKELLEFVTDELSDEEKDAIRWKPELDARKYKALDDHDVLDQAIIVKPAMPGLTITHIDEK
jgi:hypothetical protein